MNELGNSECDYPFNGNINLFHFRFGKLLCFFLFHFHLDCASIAVWNKITKQFFFSSWRRFQWRFILMKLRNLIFPRYKCDFILFYFFSFGRFGCLRRVWSTKWIVDRVYFAWSPEHARRKNGYLATQAFTAITSKFYLRHTRNVCPFFSWNHYCNFVCVSISK